MKVDYLSCRVVPSGGTKVIAQHVKLLRERGHEVRLLTTDPSGEELWGIPVARVPTFDQELLGRADLVLATWIKDVRSAVRIKGPIVCHLCQGYEPIELSFRIREERIPPKYRYQGALRRLLLFRKKWSFSRRIRKIEQVYAFPTVKIAVSSALREILEERYGKPCYVVPNGVDSRVFRPPSEPLSFKGPLRLLTVGSMDVASKGVDDVLEAIRLLKEGNVGIEFIRASLSAPTEIEKRSGLVDRFEIGLDERQMAELYRSVHILVAPSLREGFGLPVLEAMSSGVPCILTDVESYRSLDLPKDFAHFVPVRDPKAIAHGVLKIGREVDYREGLIRRGLEVAKRYSLENTGEKLEETLRIIYTSKKATFS